MKDFTVQWSISSSYPVARKPLYVVQNPATRWIPSAQGIPRPGENVSTTNGARDNASSLTIVSAEKSRSRRTYLSYL